MRILLLTIPLALLLSAGSQAAGPDARFAGSWIGTYTLNGPGQVSLVVGAGRAIVVLGVGHADVQTVPAKIGRESHPLPAAGPADATRLRRRSHEADASSGR